MDNPTLFPLYCIETKDKVSNKQIFINIAISNAVDYPPVDFDSTRLMTALSENGSAIAYSKFPIPRSICPILWTEEEEGRERHYVTDVIINDKFGMHRVIGSEFMLLYLADMAMFTLEQHCSDASFSKCGQFLGHKLDLCRGGYVKLELKVFVKKSNEIVNNKVTFVGEAKSNSSSDESGKFFMDYRPASRMLVCTVLTGKVPDVGFSDDRIIVKLGETTLFDTYLPFHINLKEPMKFLFEKKLGFIGLIFKILQNY